MNLERISAPLFVEKNSLIEGALIATLGIVIVKVIGLLYVIPFNAIIGEQGGALYGYAYNIYSIFLGISTAGIPLAMSKLISEYHTMGYIKTKERAFRLGKKVLNVMGIISFILLMIFDTELFNVSFPAGSTYLISPFMLFTF